jgi:hypothetical protein
MRWNAIAFRMFWFEFSKPAAKRPVGCGSREFFCFGVKIFAVWGANGLPAAGSG